MSLPKISSIARNREYQCESQEANEEACLTPNSDAASFFDAEIELKPAKKYTHLRASTTLQNGVEPDDDDQFLMGTSSVITILRAIGFIPSLLPTEKFRFVSKARRHLLFGFYFFITISFFLINAFIFAFNMYIVAIST